MLHRFFETQHQRINTLHLHKNDGIRKDQHILLGLAPDNNIIATENRGSCSGSRNMKH